jgi:hypothetical protein
MGQAGRPQPTGFVVDTDSSGGLDAELSPFDYVVVTWDASESSTLSTAITAGQSCGEDTVVLAVISGLRDSSAVGTELREAFDTVVLLGEEGLVQEFVTDLFTWTSQPMLLRTDCSRIRTNLKGGAIAGIHRAVGSRENLDNLVERSLAHPVVDVDAKGGRTLFGYAEFGAAFTVADAERLRAASDPSHVITGQATLGDENGCRLSLLRVLNE